MGFRVFALLGGKGSSKASVRVVLGTCLRDPIVSGLHKSFQNLTKIDPKKDPPHLGARLWVTGAR